VTRNQIRSAVAGLAGLVLGFLSYAFLGYPEWGIGIGLVTFGIVWLVSAIRNLALKLLFFPTVSFLLGFFLFVPFGCASGSHTGPNGIGQWDCQAVTGWTLPGFSGTGNASPSYLPALTAGLAAALVAVAVVMPAVVRARQGKRLDPF
jgi:hypothetical protein